MIYNTIETIVLTDSQSPRHILITRSGWDDWYHVIYEDPEDGDLDHAHKFMSKKEVLTRFPDIPLTTKRS